MGDSKVGLVACAKSKLDRQAPARKLYTSPLFKYASKYAEQQYDSWFVLSAKHGLVSPDLVIVPYNQTLNGKSSSVRLKWSEMVLREIRSRCPDPKRCTFYLHACKCYCEALVIQLTQAGYKYEIPLAGLGIGRQLSWYKARL